MVGSYKNHRNNILRNQGLCIWGNYIHEQAYSEIKSYTDVELCLEEQLCLMFTHEDDSAQCFFSDLILALCLNVFCPALPIQTQRELGDGHRLDFVVTENIIIPVLNLALQLYPYA